MRSFRVARTPTTASLPARVVKSDRHHAASDGQGQTLFTFIKSQSGNALVQNFGGKDMLLLQGYAPPARRSNSMSTGLHGIRSRWTAERGAT